MKNNAVVELGSVQNDQQEEKIELVSPGLFYKEDDLYKLKYQETELSGLGDTLTTFEIGRDYFNLVRTGEVNTTMEFKKGGSTTIIYNTPQGSMSLHIRTKDVNINIDDNGGKVYVNYDILVSKNDIINTKLTANIKVNN